MLLSWNMQSRTVAPDICLDARDTCHSDNRNFHHSFHCDSVLVLLSQTSHMTTTSWLGKKLVKRMWRATRFGPEASSAISLAHFLTVKYVWRRYFQREGCQAGCGLER